MYNIELNKKTDVFHIFAKLIMIKYKEFYLENGLRVIVHEDHAIPLAVVNLLYNVGSRDEHLGKTGFAHLFEHLMFGGSKNINSFDTPLQKVGGENNAFTSPDITNYYISIPAVNIETAFWLESDRMLSLSFDPNVLEIQRKVVIEEFKQRYLDEPYGDVWLKLRPLAYQKHSYKWPTIGENISHIEQATMEDVKDFFFKYYRPNNAILVIAGAVKLEEIKRLSEKWFSPIQAGKIPERNIPIEPRQTLKRTLTTSANVPMNAIYSAYHMPARLSKDYHASDLLSDILGRGKASRLYSRLVKQKKLFTSLNAYVTGSIDPGLFVIEGKIKKDVSFKEAENEIREVINSLIIEGIGPSEIQKVKNQATTSLAFSEVELLNRAMNLAYFANLGDPEYYNEELQKINKVEDTDIIEASKNILVEPNSNILYYQADENG